MKTILIWTGNSYEETTFDKLPVGKNITIKILERIPKSASNPVSN